MNIFLCLSLICALFSWAAEGAESESIKAVVKTGGFDLKTRPDIDSDTIISVKGGQAVLIVVCLKETDVVSGLPGRWCLVRYRGVDGWMINTCLDTEDPAAEKTYRDVPALDEETDALYRAKESHDLEETARLGSLIVSQVEENFSEREIRQSKRLSSTVLSCVSDRIEALVFLHRFEEARRAYDYLMKTYPDATLESDSITARELTEPYMVFIDNYGSAALFDNPKEPMEELRKALGKRDISRVSKLAVPGVFEVWVAYTDWVVKLGEKKLDDESWLSQSWETNWKIEGVTDRRDDRGKIIGHCVVTKPWKIDYYDIPVTRVDFCIDRLPDGTYAFSYLILYTIPTQ